MGNRILEVYDVSNPLQIQKVGEFSGTGVLYYLDIFVRNQKAYLFDFSKQRVDVLDISVLDEIEKVGEMSFQGTTNYRFSFMTEDEILWITNPNVLYGYNMDSGNLISFRDTQSTHPNGIGKIGSDIFIFDLELGMTKVSL